MGSQFDRLMDAATDPFTREIHYQHPLAFAAKVQDADNPGLREVLALPDSPERDQWIESMYNELDELQDKDTFEIVDRSDAGRREVVPSSWAFKRKRYPDGRLMKIKSRFVVRGDLQRETRGAEIDTYAPVVDWGTIRLVFSLAVNYGLHTQQIDFKNAFVQSTLPEPFFLELPPGPFRNNPDYKDKILKVQKSLYGDRRAPRLWYDHLRSALTSEKYGFVVSELDPCLFLKDDLIIVVYVDDAIIVSKDSSKVDDIIQTLKDDHFDLTQEGSLSAYLGIDIKTDPTDGSLYLSQPALTQKVIELLGLENGAGKDTPASGPLGKCSDADPITGRFSYRSAIGMQMYLTGNTRPDCQFAVHQCARFSHAPKYPHEQAVKRIGRYLLQTATKGIRIKPSRLLTLDCYVDADFAGLWGAEPPDDEMSVRSRTGYVVMLGQSPVLWASKLQTETATSTMAAEYIALSTAMRAIIPLRHIYFDLTKALRLPQDEKSSLTTVFEDNQAALKLATSTDPPRLTPQSKHLAVKYHWFRSKLAKGQIEIIYVQTDFQKADLMTKALSKIKFEYARKLVMGW